MKEKMGWIVVLLVVAACALFAFIIVTPARPTTCSEATVAHYVGGGVGLVECEKRKKNTPK